MATAGTKAGAATAADREAARRPKQAQRAAALPEKVSDATRIRLVNVGALSAETGMSWTG